MGLNFSTHENHLREAVLMTIVSVHIVLCTRNCIATNSYVKKLKFLFTDYKHTIYTVGSILSSFHLIYIHFLK